MIESLLPELLGDTRRLAGVVLALLAFIYISGFLIVNLYLGHFGVVCLDLIQARFASVGILFAAISGTAGLFAVLLLAIISVPLGWADRVAEDPLLVHDLRRPFRQILEVLHRRLGTLCFRKVSVGVLLGMSVTIFICAFGPVQSLSSQVMAYLLCRTGDGVAQMDSIASDLVRFTRLQGLSAFLICLILFHAGRLNPRLIRGLVATSLIVFLATQAYALLYYEDKLYESLPRSVGGGQSVSVQFLAETGKVEALAELGVPIETPAKGSIPGRTGEVQLIAQKHSDGESTTYIVLPQCQGKEPCQAIEFNSSLILGVVYLRPTDNP